MTTWIGFQTSSGSVCVAPAEEVFSVVGVGQSLTVLSTGLDGYKVANHLHTMGYQPDMRFAHAHIRKKGRVGRPARPIVCNETGVVYDSINAASKATGAAVGNLSTHLRYPAAYKTVGGHTFSYYDGL